MNNIKTKWLEALGNPSYEIPKEPIKLIKRYEYEDFDLEVYEQKNAPESSQRVMIALPKNCGSLCPAVVVPFYFPERMLGFDPETGEIREKDSKIAIMTDLVKKGYITISADAYHLTYTQTSYKNENFELWSQAGTSLIHDNPDWSGMGKLVSDTMLLIDAVASDGRADSSHIGIMGHSLGGKMSFYTGCLDERVKVIVASDFGMRWEQSNWCDVWYWNNKVEELIEAKMDHSELLSIASPKPFCLIAGEYDDETSWEIVQKASGYEVNDERLKFINHATGHNPPQWALEEAYDFLDKWL